jgi:hypothetical protein
MHYQTNKANNKLLNRNLLNPIQNLSQNKLCNTLQPKTYNFPKQENNIQTENSENTINNINPLSKSKESNSN